MSKQRRHKSQRLPKEWAIRLGAAGLALVVGFYSVSDTLANVVVKADPVRAHALAPWDGKITGKLAEHEQELAFVSKSDADPAETAKLALRQDPTSVEIANRFGAEGAGCRAAGESSRAVQPFARTVTTRIANPHMGYRRGGFTR